MIKINFFNNFFYNLEDYNLQNIMFVHNFVFIFLTYVFIFVFWMLIRTGWEFNNDAAWKSSNLLFYDRFKEYLKSIKKYDLKSTYLFLEYQLISISHLLKNKKTYLNIFEGKSITHNMKLEFIWTLIPIVIILEMILPSLSLIADDEIDHKGSLYTVGVLGNQWYWNYELNLAAGVVKFVSNLVSDPDALKSYDVDVDEEGNMDPYSGKTVTWCLTVLGEEVFYGQIFRLLNVFESLPIVVGVKTSFYITSNDVNHSFAIPALGIKVDAIPGRINLKTVIASRLGLYSGMCSELCGTDHGFMPISVKVLTFSKWWHTVKYSLDEVKSEQVLNLGDIWYGRD